MLHFHRSLNQLIWISVTQDIFNLLRDIHLAYLLILAHVLNDQMNSEFDDQGQFRKVDLSTSIFKKIIFAFKDSKTIR